MTLDKLKIGEKAVIKTVGGTGALRLRFLDMGLIPNTEVRMLKRAPMGDPLDIVLRGYELTLRVEDAQKIEVGSIEENEHIGNLPLQEIKTAERQRFLMHLQAQTSTSEIFRA